jgi:hypothetical protein
MAATAEKWVRELQQAKTEDRNRVRQQAKDAVDIAQARGLKLDHRDIMSDAEIAFWLKDKENFYDTFPEKTNLDEASRLKLLEEWREAVPPAKEWNTRVESAGIDYRRIAMELVVVTALCTVGIILIPRRA